ncbi:UDP-phosphate galactose phosphotransferase [Enterococcus ureilyticus]|uniref:UDP-phosphate galactose phosphotransferase n=1 Tax=Enterococcus ureilyticus TaxID=1131292 RepID=A0A1E5HF85_9ENTE|nr:sugar transferase [Enterococcus ureilyticus]MBM7689340.1 lipopolysaccharide/colanic/teichoic acid biosynthesis glycosyltransferase [Enterococcus ureilyticus]OEG23608.1 UDP-phosphate galactose phosphotransferase [Enterococcus ureilyticus]
MEGKFVNVGKDKEKKQAYIKRSNESNNSHLERDFAQRSLSFRISKRGLDILGSLIGLICFSPLFLIVAFLIKKEDSKGHVLFAQQRVGKNGKPFIMYKFRSMCTDAEKKLDELLEYNEIEGAMFKIKKDPRVTKIGKKLRQTSIDELPQLWNVLKGDMTLVGPRPPLEREVKEYSQHDMLRLTVKPGCTGLWQICGRNDIHFDDMVELDLEYIANPSLMSDIKIIFATAKTMLSINSNSNGAY